MPISYAFILFPGFPMMAFSALVEPLRAANQISGKVIYKWMVTGAGDKPILASSGFSLLPTMPFSVEMKVDRIVVCSGGDGDRLDASTEIKWIREMLRKGAALGAVADASFVLARAGLLDGYRCTIHWTSQPAFAESFPNIQLERSLFVIDRNRFTALGGVASLDMQLALIERDIGTEIAHGVADWFVHSSLRSPEERRPMPASLRHGIRDNVVLNCIAQMEHNIETPLTVSELSRRVSVSEDTLERAFQAAFGKSPGYFYRRMRLTHGRSLLEHSGLRIREIAQACGYSDQAAFSRAFRSEFGSPPAELRQSR